MEVIPGILEKEWSEIKRKIEILKSFTKSAHIDIIDGKFTQNTTFLDPQPFSKYSKELFLELHMMVDDPIQYLKPFAKAGFKRFIGHIEKMPDQEEFVAQAQMLGEVGLAIDGPTDINSVKVPFSDLDCILVMTIKAGESGQTFIPEYLKKAEILRSAQNDIEIPIEIDGGINSQTIIQARNAGASRFVSTSFIFNPSASSGQNPQSQFSLLKDCLRS